MKTLLKLFYILFFLNASSQESIKHFSVKNGLPHDVTYGVFQDTQGYIWIGTDDGIVKYNGTEFKTFSRNNGLRSNYVIGVSETKSNGKVLATWGGGIQFIKNDSVISSQINDNEVTKLQYVYPIDDAIFSTSNGKSYFYEYTFLDNEYHKNIKYLKRKSKTNFDIVETDLDIPELAFDISKLDNEIYFHHLGSYHDEQINLKGVFKKDGNELHAVFPEHKDELISSIGRLNTTKVYLGGENTLYIYENNLQTIKYNIDVDNNFIVKAFLGDDKNEIILLASNSRGIKQAYLFNISNQETINLAETYTIRSSISDILKDHEGNIWLTSFGDGVYYINKLEYLVNYNFQEELKNTSIVDISKDQNGNNLVLTNEYFYLIDKNSKEITKKINLKGLGKYIDIYKDTIRISSLASDLITTHSGSIIEYKKNKLMHIEELGSVEINRSEFIIPKFNKRIAIDDKTFFSDATYLNNSLYLSSNLGLYKFNLKNNTYDKICNEKVNMLLQSNDTIWLATNQGVKRVVNDSLFSIAHENKLMQENINTLFIDHHKQLWIGTQKGAFVYKNGVFKFFYNNAALSSSYVSAIYEDNEKNIWIGGNKGITIIKNDIPRELVSPPVINVFPESNKFVIDVVSFNQTNAYEKQFKLNTQAWKVLSSKEFEYSNFHPGSYKIIFRAKKQNSDWIESESFTFNVTEQWYKSELYLMLLSSAIFALVVVLINVQLKRVKKRNEILNTAINRKIILENELSNVRDDIAKDFHDDLGNKLAKITALSDLMTYQHKTENELKDALNLIKTDSDILYKGTRDFMFSLKANSDYLEEIITYLSDFGEDFYSDLNIDFFLEKSIMDNRKLPNYWNRQIILIFKEAMTNAAKHSECTKVVLGFLYHNNTLSIKLEDDGVGFNINLPHKKGLENMNSRARKIHAMLNILSNADGTVVEFIGVLPESGGIESFV